jgi:hypothetical protein
MLHGFRHRPAYPKFTLIVIRVNIGLCLFGIAAIITALLS